VAEIFVGSVSVGVVPNAKDFNTELRRQLFPDAENIGREYGDRLGRGMRDALQVSIDRIKADMEKGFTANVSADTTKAKDEIDAMRAEEEARDIKVKVKADESSLHKFGQTLLGSLGMGAKNLGLGALVGTGGFAVSSMGLAAAGPLAAAGAGIAGFAAIAIPEITKVEKALKTAGPAGQKAWQQLTPQEREIGQAFKGVRNAFHGIQQEVAPAVDHIVAMGADLAKDVMPALGELARIGAKVIGDFIGPLDKFLMSPATQHMGDVFGRFALQAGKLVGPWLVQLIKAFAQLFVQLLPSGMKILRVLLPLIVQLVQDLAPGIVVMAKVAAATLDWLNHTHLLIPALWAILGVVVIVVGPTGLGGIIAAIVFMALTIGFFATHWKQIWTDIKNWAMDAWNFLTHGWGQLLIPGLTAIRMAVQFVRDHWRQAWNDIKSFTATLWHYIGPLFKIGFDIITGLVLALVALFRADWHLIATIAAWLWNVILTGARSWWSSVKPIVKGFSDFFVFIFKQVIEPAAKWLWDHFTSMLQNAINIGKTVFRALWTVISTVFGWIIHGAANAFGWIPGLGPKLKAAAAQFDIFKARVNSALNGLNNKTISVDVGFKAFKGARGPASPAYPGGVGAAGGGLITGPGTWTSDTAGIYALSNQEWVIRASSASRYGYAAMDAVNKGTAIIHYAQGGPIGMATGGVIVNPHTPSLAQINASMLPIVRAMAQEWASAMATQMPGGVGDTGARSGNAMIAQAFARSLLGYYGWGSSQMAPLIMLWNQESGWNAYAVNPSSGAYGIPQSLGHGHPYNLGDYKAQIIWGLAYIHSVYGSPMAAWAHEVSHNWYDQGGWLQPGWNLNMLSKPEPVLTPGQWDAVYAAAKGGDGNGATYNLNFDGLTRQTIQGEVMTAMRMMDIHRGNQARAGRRS
jgi:hypothetical protein